MAARGARTAAGWRAADWRAEMAYSESDPEGQANVAAFRQGLQKLSTPGLDTADLGPTRRGLPQRIRATIATWKNVRVVESDAEIMPGSVRSRPSAQPRPNSLSGHIRRQRAATYCGRQSPSRTVRAKS